MTVFIAPENTGQDLCVQVIVLCSIPGVVWGTRAQGHDRGEGLDGTAHQTWPFLEQKEKDKMSSLIRRPGEI